MGTAQAVQGFVGEVMSVVTAPVDALNLAVAKATLDVLQFLPKMPAARLYTDLVFQFGHSHPHPPTFGFPIPSVGPILASGCISVLINGLPAARNGDMGLSVWCGGYFPIFEVMTGSSHVFIGGSRAARQLMDPTLHCLPDMFGGKWGIGKLEIAGAVFGIGMSALSTAAAFEKAGEADIVATETASDDQGSADAQMAAAAAAAAGVGAATAAAQLAADIAATAMGLLMGKDPGIGFPFGMITMGSPNVLVGGFPMPGWMNILKGLFKLIKPIIRRIQMKLPPGKLRNSLCFATGHPVEVVTGRMFTQKNDFEIAGRIPISFDRIYDTSAVDYESSLGWGWTHPYDQHLWESKRYNCLILRNEENRQIRFDKLVVGQRQFQPLERIWLERKTENLYEIYDCKTGLFYNFGSVTETEEFKSEKTALRLTEVFDRNGNRLELKHDNGFLTEINGGSGDFVRFHYHDTAGKTRLTEIRHHLRNGQDISLMKFGYNGDAELISASDRTYAAYTYQYENHLMTKETNRNGLSFQFEYEGAGQTARCVHTWGDGDIYERHITYLPKAKMTKVKDGLGGETIYHYNDLELVTKLYDAEGGLSQFEYGETGETLKSIDELGRTKTYKYDEQLNCIGVVEAEGTQRQVEFNDFCQPTVIADEAGSQWLREYDKRGNIVKTINPLGAEREYEYNRVGDITKFRDALGSETVFEWNNAGQVISVKRPLGDKSLYSYNERNFLSEVTNEFTGLKVTYQYDDAGRVKRVAEINGRKETLGVQRYEYDDQSNLLLYVDSLGNRTVYNYSGYDKLAERTDALGYRRKFKYDREERLNEIINERGENYLFEHDLLDRVTKETGFDRAQRIYQYNPAGELVFLKDALNRETFYQRDSSGKVTRRLRSDSSTVSYSYDNCGRITTAQTVDNTVSLTYDAAWQVISEDQNGQKINFEYDAEGRRTARILNKDNSNSSRIVYDYDADSNLSLVKIGDREFNYERDRAGRLTNRQMPNGLREQFDYDINGRLSGQKVTIGGGREIVKRGYEWDALGNVVGITDSLRGARRYTYDAVERLNKVERIIAGENVNLPQTDIKPNSKTALPADKRLWQADDRAGADLGQRETEEFQYDGDGNLLERKSSVKGARQFKYGAGDRLEQQDKVQYIYDAVGNLIQKRQASGAVISYEYDADNQLISVSTETGGKVEFKYDAFGRRTAKISEKGETGFLWDGNVLLSESKDSQFTAEYVHEGFVPLAKIKNSQIETYHTDYLGTPKEVSNQNGEIVWQGNYDEYGKVTSVKGETEQNIRFQGQYEDAETGLFYNNFRYYDSDSSRYINQDPIGLAGDFNPYRYCTNPLVRIDPLGLDELVYQLIKDGKVVYIGITEQTATARGNQHIRGDAARGIDPKDFDSMQVIAKGLNHDQARSLEGALIRERLRERKGDYSAFDSVEDRLKKSGLLNKNRGRVEERWIKDPLTNVKRLDTPEDVDGLKNKKADTC